MALSGSFSGSIAGGKYKLRVDWSATQNVAKNTSKITCVMYLVQANSWSLGISTRADNKTTINGTALTWSSPAISNSGGKTTKLATVTSGEIKHNADGSKSVTISAAFNIRATISGTYYSSITASASISLNTIAPATQPTLSASSVNMGDSVTISLPRADSGLTHSLAFLWEGTGLQFIADNVGTSYKWTVPDLASSIPSKTSGRITLEVTTYSGSRAVGTKRAYLTAKVPASVVPTVSAPTLAEATAGLAAQFGAYVQSKSRLAVTVNASGAKGSTIVAYKTTILGQTYTAKSFTSPVLSQAGNISLVTKVKDSRGRWSAARTTTVTALAYKTPQVPTFRAYRVDNSGAAAEEGVYLALAYKYEISAVNNKNSVSVTIEYKRHDAASWTTLLAPTVYSANTTYKPKAPTFSVGYQYDFRLTVEDFFGSRIYETTLPSAKVILDLLADGTGIALGKTADQAGIDFGWPVVGRAVAMGSLSGQHRLESGLLLQWGVVSITPSAAKTPTEGALAYPTAYTRLPVMFLSVVSSVPEKCSVGIKDRTTASCSVVLTRTDTTSTVINWLAIGPG